MPRSAHVLGSQDANLAKSGWLERVRHSSANVFFLSSHLNLQLEFGTCRRLVVTTEITCLESSQQTFHMHLKFVLQNESYKGTLRKQKLIL